MLLSQYTWTGKGKNGDRKHSFGKHKQLVKVIYEAVRAGDSRYSLAQCKLDLVNKVFKYAYRKARYAIINYYIKPSIQFNSNSYFYISYFTAI